MQLVCLLEGYYLAVANAVRMAGGVINRYVGDRVMATFNAPAALSGFVGQACTTQVVREGMKCLWEA